MLSLVCIVLIKMIYEDRTEVGGASKHKCLKTGEQPDVTITLQKVWQHQTTAVKLMLIY